MRRALVLASFVACCATPGESGGTADPEGLDFGGGPFGSISGGAGVVLEPAEGVDFGVLPVGETAFRTVEVRNTGAVDVTVTEVSKTGSEDFELGPLPGLPLVLGPGKVAEIWIWYMPSDQGEDGGTLRVVAGGPEGGSGEDGGGAFGGGGDVVHEVALHGRTHLACFSVAPTALDFGGRVVGELAKMQLALTSCGTAPLYFESWTIPAGSSEEFSVGWENAPGDPPFVLPPGGTMALEVRYLPEDVSGLDAAGEPVQDTAVLRFETSAAEPVVDVELRGFGIAVAEDPCWSPVIDIFEGTEVDARTTLHLSASESVAPAGDVTAFEWAVKEPIEVQPDFSPNAAVADPTFEVAAVGEYVFVLRAWDSNGEPSCADAIRAVNVVPDTALHVELTWHTPLDPDETDQGPNAGADLDLHFLHPFAAGEDLDGDGFADGWFDQPFDCYWFNPSPNWGSLDPMVGDDPDLEREEDDGLGPEIVTLEIPEEGLTYRVGVHAGDHAYGVSFARLRVFVYGALAFDAESPPLAPLDLWEAATIAWPSGSVQSIAPLGAPPKVLHGVTGPP